MPAGDRRTSWPTRATIELEHHVDAVRVALPRIDLRHQSLEHICFIAVFEDTGPFAGLVSMDGEDDEDGRHDSDDEGRGFGSVIKYRRSRVEYAITESVGIDRFKDSDVAMVRIAYDVNDEEGPYPLGTPPKSLRREGLVFGRLLANQTTVPFSCHAEFSYPALEEGSAVATSLSLPLRPISEADEEIYDEIHAVTGAKYGAQDERRLQYRFRLEREPDRGVSLSLWFGYVATPDAELPRNVIARASELASKFVPTDRKGGRP